MEVGVKPWTVLESSMNAKSIGKSHRNKHMPLKLVKTIKKGLCSAAQNDLMHFGMKNGGFCFRVFKKV